MWHCMKKSVSSISYRSESVSSKKSPDEIECNQVYFRFGVVTGDRFLGHTGPLASHYEMIMRAPS